MERAQVEVVAVHRRIHGRIAVEEKLDYCRCFGRFRSHRQLKMNVRLSLEAMDHRLVDTTGDVDQRTVAVG